MSLIDPAGGTYAYDGGASGTVTLTANQRVIRVWATGDGGTIQIDGGAEIPTDGGVNLLPSGLRIGEVIAAGTTAFLVEWLEAD